MAKFSINIGVNRSEAPGFNLPTLKGPENDAKAMHEIAKKEGFASNGPILGDKATFERVKQELKTAANSLHAGDLLLFTFAGHGTRDAALELEGEEDGFDETIALFDTVLLDTYFLRVLWPMFDEGVRIFAVSDSCHSGTVFFLSDDELIDSGGGSSLEEEVVSSGGPLVRVGGSLEEEIVSSGGPLIRSIPEHQMQHHLELRKEFFAALKAEAASNNKPIKANILSLGACPDKQETADGDPNGVFTQALIKVWKGGSFSGSHRDFRKAIEQELLPQTPVLHTKFANEAFITQRPFTI